MAYVRVVQAINGIGKDRSKMSAKSALKTVSFFLGGVLLTTLGFNAAGA